MKKRWLAGGVGALVAIAPLATLAWFHYQRPPREAVERPLFQGITYRREVRSHPRPLMIHIVQIDLTDPALRVQVTPGSPAAADPEAIPTELDARTTSEFLQEFDLKLAVNANFFYEFREATPWNFYPRSGQRVSAVGEAVADGTPYSTAEASWPVLCFAGNNQAQIQPDTCPPGTRQGVAGSHLLIVEGQPTTPSEYDIDQGLHSRTVAALDRAGETVWLVAIDDKQPRYSEGVTSAEMADLLMEIGVHTALNLDGGGSTTLVMADGSSPRVLNAPIHTKIPMRERSVANHLGFDAAPLP